MEKDKSICCACGRPIAPGTIWQTALEYWEHQPGECVNILLAEIARLKKELSDIRYAGNNSRPTAIWMQKVAAHAMQPGWPDPGEQPGEDEERS